jgi:hypothetical protein
VPYRLERTIEKLMDLGEEYRILADRLQMGR